MELNTERPSNPSSPATSSAMRVRKRNGTLVPVDVMKIVHRVTKLCFDLEEIDPHRVAIKAISGLYDGASTKELDNLCIQTAAMLIGEEPQYSRLAARLLSTYIDEEVAKHGIHNFFDSMTLAVEKGLIQSDTLAFVEENRE